MTRINCIVATETRTIAGHYNGGAVLTPYPSEQDGQPAIGWECLMSVERGPALLAPSEPPIVRYSANHGSRAALTGGSRITIAAITPQEAAEHERQIAARFWA
jgi:hypothetical protein